MRSPELDLPTDPHERALLLSDLADHEPIVMRQWLEQHPRNLMAYHGWATEDFHVQALDDGLKHPQTFWLAPRGSGKSTAYLFLCTWAAIASPDVYTKAGIDYLFPGAPKEIGPHNIRVGLTSNSAEKAITLHWQARAILTDDKMAKLYGPLEGSRWKDTLSDTALRREKLREGTFTAAGLGSKVTGFHYDLAFADDWVTEDNARTDLQRGRIKDFWKFTIRGCLEPWARTLGAGTRYHPHDWYNDIIEWRDKGLWKHIRHTQALTEEGGVERSYWPAVYTLQKLQEIREEIGEIAFQTQYQNVIDVMLGDFFDAAWLERYRRWEDLPEKDKKSAVTFIALDPAIKAGKRNDYTVFAIISYVAPYFYVRRLVRGQFTEDETKRWAKVLCKMYRPRVLGVEAVGGLEWLVNSLQKMGLPVRALRPQQFKGRDKIGRASHVRTFFENGRVWLEEPEPGNNIQRFVHEAMAFPGAEHTPGMDDCVDAVVWGLLLATRSRSRVIKLRNRRGI